MIRVVRFRRNEAKRIHIYLETNLGYSRYSNDIYIGILRIKMNDNLRDIGGRGRGIKQKDWIRSTPLEINTGKFPYHIFRFHSRTDVCIHSFRCSVTCIWHRWGKWTVKLRLLRNWALKYSQMVSVSYFNKFSGSRKSSLRTRIWKNVTTGLAERIGSRLRESRLLTPSGRGGRASLRSLRPALSTNSVHVQYAQLIFICV